MLAFPIEHLMNEQKCYEFLKGVLHPEGLRCPRGHSLLEDQVPHNRERAPVMDYKCRQCQKVFNIFTNTVLHNITFDCCEIVLLLRGIVQDEPTTQIALELGRDYNDLLQWRQRIQEQGLADRVAAELSNETEK